ncbi:MAG: hypothetical protein CMO55_12680 [Verrucomicrobiales bacterium]|nr:hypothetical protein [Verrucomicrobiales bacterium]
MRIAEENTPTTKACAPRPVRRIIVSFLSLSGLVATGFSQEIAHHTSRELEAIIEKIEAIEIESTEVTSETVGWLMEIISSKNTDLHRPFVVTHEQSGTSYHPTSSYAIWALSSLIKDTPYTYTDPGWETGAHMIGERKRWVEWWKKNKSRLQIRESRGHQQETQKTIESEKQRQAENLEMYRNISRIQSRGGKRDFFELEHEVLFGKSDGK